MPLVFQFDPPQSQLILDKDTPLSVVHSIFVRAFECREVFAHGRELELLVNNTENFPTLICRAPAGHYYIGDSAKTLARNIWLLCTYIPIKISMSKELDGLVTPIVVTAFKKIKSLLGVQGIATGLDPSSHNVEKDILSYLEMKYERDFKENLELLVYMKEQFEFARAKGSFDTGSAKAFEIINETIEELERIKERTDRE